MTVPIGELAEAYAGKRVCVIGGTGFLGYNLVCALARCGVAVTAASRGQTPSSQPLPAAVSYCPIDLRDEAGMTRLVANSDVIFSVAGRPGAIASIEAPEEDMQINLLGQYKLLNACVRSGNSPRLVFASTRLVYGKAQMLPVAETHPTDPTSMYGIHTLAAEKYHLLYQHSQGVRTTVLRITVPYGPYMPPNTSTHGVINHFIRTAVSGGAICLFGGGHQIRDVLYIDDLVKAFLEVGRTETLVGAVVNVGSGIRQKLHDIARAIIATAGAGRIEFAPWPDNAVRVETGDFYADIGRITTATGWRPEVSLKEGIERTVAYYQADRG